MKMKRSKPRQKPAPPPSDSLGSEDDNPAVENGDDHSDDHSDEFNRARDTALNLLTRREHSALELRHKLSQRGFSRDIITPVLEQLSEQDWLSDQRFAEVYSHSRADKGYGPLRIRSELRERGVSDKTIGEMLAQLDDFWMPKLIQLQRKRFGEQANVDFDARAKQTRFLRHRGYTLSQINQLFQ